MWRASTRHSTTGNSPMWALPGGYTRIPVAAGRGAVLRFVYARPHKSKDPSTPRDRTLFVSNVPHGVDDATIRDAWQSAYGPVASVSRVAASASTPSSVIVVFESASSMTQALGSGDRVLALPEVRSELSKPSHSQAFAELRDRALKAEANEFMLRFDQAQAAARAVEADAEGVPDADGFITVTRTNKRLKRAGDDAAAAAQPEKKKKVTELHDFYHFQKHERKREHLQKLRQRFEDDKQRIAAMKAQRRFRPD